MNKMQLGEMPKISELDHVVDGHSPQIGIPSRSFIVRREVIGYAHPFLCSFVRVACQAITPNRPRIRLLPRLGDILTVMPFSVNGCMHKPRKRGNLSICPDYIR